MTKSSMKSTYFRETTSSSETIMSKTTTAKRLATSTSSTQLLPPESSQPPKYMAYVTYHMYDASTLLLNLACSDGVNGLITRMELSTLGPIFPGVMAASYINWNSNRCGECIKLSSALTSVFVRVIDHCELVGEQTTHFDLDPVSYQNLLGSEGMSAGHAVVEWSIVDSSKCKGTFR